MSLHPHVQTIMREIRGTRHEVAMLDGLTAAEGEIAPQGYGEATHAAIQARRVEALRERAGQ